MSLASWGERPLGPRSFIGLAVTALAVLVFAFDAAKRPVDALSGSDIPGYETYGSMVLDGAMPYRDFRFEYPPGALLVFVLPATPVVAGGSVEKASWSPPDTTARRYYRGFTSLVLLLLAAMLILTALTLQAMYRPARTVLISLALVACSPLLIGQVLVERFDVWPAALTSASLAAAVRGHYRIGGMMLGLGTAAKLYPAFLVPILVIVAFRQRGVREAIVVAGTAVAVAAAAFLPVAIASLGGTWESLRVQLRGGPPDRDARQFRAGDDEARRRQAHGSRTATPSDLTAQGAGGGLVRFELVGAGVGATTTVMNVLLVLALCFLWVSFARSKRDPREELLRYAAATVAEREVVVR